VHAGVTGETVTAIAVKGLISCDAGRALALTDRGRAMLRAMLPEPSQSAAVTCEGAATEEGPAIGGGAVDGQN
jgi:hypothetical protein